VSFNFDIFSLLAITIFSLLVITYFLVIQVVILRLYHGYQNKQQQKFFSLWEGRIFEYLEGEDTPELIIKKIGRKNYIYLLRYLREFFLMLKGDDYLKLSQLVNQTKLLTFLLSSLKSGSPQKINEAAYFLGLAKSTGAVKVLRKKLRSQNASVFLSTSLALARINDTEALFEIFRGARRFKFISKDSLLAILSEYTADICPILLQNLKREKNSFVHTLSIILFRHFKFYDAAETVLKIMVYSQNKEIVIESIKYFSAVEYFEAGTALRSMLNHPKPEVRAEVLKALAIIGDASFEQRIWERMYDPEYEVQYNAVVTLMKLVPESESKITQFAYSNLKDRGAAIARMVLSERSIKN